MRSFTFPSTFNILNTESAPYSITLPRGRTLFQTMGIFSTSGKCSQQRVRTLFSNHEHILHCFRTMSIFSTSGQCSQQQVRTMFSNHGHFSTPGNARGRCHVIATANNNACARSRSPQRSIFWTRRVHVHLIIRFCTTVTACCRCTRLSDRQSQQLLHALIHVIDCPPQCSE